MSEKPAEEKKESELASKVESAFPKENANESEGQPETKPLTNEKGTELWANPDSKEKEKEKQIRPPSQTDIMLYLARETHLLRIEMEAFLNKVYASTVKQTPDVKSIPPSPSQPQLGPSSKPEKMLKIEEALSEFLSEFVEVNSTESNMFYVIRFKKFLGAEIFSKISTICRAIGGSYVSDGKKSHFTIPKQ